jgi:hypothetical protein
MEMADTFFSSSWRILEPHGCSGFRVLAFSITGLALVAQCDQQWQRDEVFVSAWVT